MLRFCINKALWIHESDMIKISRISSPTMIVPGELDPALPVAMSEIIKNKIPDSRMAVVPNAAHLCNVEQPEAFNAIILKWLNAQS